MTDSTPPRAAALISTVTTTVLWIYYSSLIFVFGAIVGQVYWERVRLRQRRSE